MKNLTTVFLAAAVTVLSSGTAHADLGDQLAKLLPSDGAAGDSFGSVVVIDGDTVILSAWKDDDNGMDSGSAYVFVKDGKGVWMQQAKLLPDDGEAGDGFGVNIAINGDTVLVGAIFDNDNGVDSGSVYVFTRNGNDLWTQQAKLLPDDGVAGDRFARVAISGDTALIGATGDDDNGTDSGSLYVFTRDRNDVWTQQGKLLPDDGAAGIFFGFTVALNRSGNTAVVGTFDDENNGPIAGSAYVFVRDTNDVWTQQAKLLPADGAENDHFGELVAISCNTALVSSRLDDDNGTDSGSVLVFTRDGNGLWTFQTKLLADDGAAEDWFGSSVAINGNLAVVGARFDDDNGFDSGSAYLFDLSDPKNPIQIAKLLASDGAAEDLFSYSVAISSTTAVAGAQFDDDNGTNSGSAYLFDTAGTPDTCPWDLDDNAIVGVTDLLSLLASWGPCECCPTDFDGDDAVGVSDLLELLANWGPCK